MPFRVTFPAGRADLLGRLSRRRWRAEFEGPCAGISGTLVVHDERALPAPGSGKAVAAAALHTGAAEILPMDSGAPPGPSSWSPPPALTVSEFERIGPVSDAQVRDLPEAPLFPPARFLPDGEVRGSVLATGFRVLRVPGTFGIREEILERVPPGAHRLLDVGCGGGETAAEARRRIRGLRVEGIDRDGGSGIAARSSLDVFHPGDAFEVLELLSTRGERFDVLVFADVLEHCEDPFLVLEAAREICAPGATAIVSVPNAASAPVVEDLISGRFDPVGAGPEDAGHLRWFTRATLKELLEESGFGIVTLDDLPLPGDTGFAGRLARAGIAFDAGDIAAVQWLAVATAGAPVAPGHDRR